MGGDITKPDTPVKYPAFAELVAGLPPDTLIFFTIGASATTPRVEHVAVLGEGILPPQLQTERMQVTNAAGLNVRAGPSLNAPKTGKGLAYNAIVEVVGSIPADGFTWTQIAAGEYRGNYVAREYLKPV